MDDDLEKLLARYRPIGPPQGLRDRVLRAAGDRRMSRSNWSAASVSAWLPAAAAVLIAVSLYMLAAKARGSAVVMPVAAAANEALALASVPPENVADMSRTRVLTRLAAAPKTFFASSCTKNTPSSNGMESKPQENMMRAPLDFAVASCASIIWRIQTGSPQRSK